MSQHTLQTEVEVKFHIPGMPDDEREVAYPALEITYNFAAARPAYTPPGEYAPVDPPEPAEVDFVGAKLIDGDGLAPSQSQVEEWAKDWLYDEGYETACDRAEDARQPDPDRWYDEHRDERMDD